MSQEDVLTLAARVKDESSGVIAAMAKAWQAFNESVKKGHAESVKGAKEHGKEVTELREKFKDMRREVMEGVAPALAELGLGFFSVGGAIETVIGNLKSAAEQFNVFRDASARAHASVDFLQSMSATMAHLTGESAEQATQNLANFGEQLDRITRGRSDTLNGLSNLYAGLKETLGESLKGKSVPEALEVLMKWKEEHPEIAVDKVRDVFRYLGLEVRLATVPLKEFEEVRAANEKSWRDHPFDMEAAHRLDEALHHLTGTVAEFNRDMVHAFGKDGGELIDMFVAGIKHNVEDVKQIIKDWRDFIDRIGRNLGFRDDSPEQKKFDEEQKRFKYIPPSIKPGTTPITPPGGIFPGGASHTAFSSSSESETLFTRSIHAGTLAALTDWYGQLSGKHDGIVPASYGGSSGSAGGGRGWGGGGYSVLGGKGEGGVDTGDQGGNLPGGGPKPMPGGADNTAGGGGAGGGDTSLQGSSFLASQRARMLEEVRKDPQLAKELRGVAMLEDAHDPEGVIESLANRSAMTGKSLRSLIHGGFYGPVNRGRLPGAIAQIESNERLKARMQAGIDSVWAGANRLKGATDQGMPGDPNASWPGGMIHPPGATRGAIYNDWGGGVGGHAASARFREAQQAQVNRDLLSNGAAAGMGGVHKVEGDAHLKVDLNGFPKGTRTDLTFGGLFTQYTLSRGQQMQESEQN